MIQALQTQLAATSMKLPMGEFPSEFSVEKNGIRDWKCPDALDMIANPHSEPVFVLFYHPKCPWCKKIFQEWIKLAQRFNVDGSGVKIEAVNGSYCLKRLLGVKTYPDFRLFRQGTDPQGVRMPKDPANRTFEGFSKFLKENGIAAPQDN